MQIVEDVGDRKLHSEAFVAFTKQLMLHLVGEVGKEAREAHEGVLDGRYTGMNIIVSWPHYK